MLEALAHHLTPLYRSRWNREVGVFVARLYGKEESVDAEVALGPAVWPEGYPAVAERLAGLNLQDSAERGHILSTGFIKELCSVGWRNTLLSQLRRQGESDFAGLMERVVGADERLRQKLGGRRRGGAAQLELWFELWQAHRRAARQRQKIALPALLVDRLTQPR